MGPTELATNCPEATLAALAGKLNGVAIFVPMSSSVGDDRLGMFARNAVSSCKPRGPPARGRNGRLAATAVATPAADDPDAIAHIHATQRTLGRALMAGFDG